MAKTKKTTIDDLAVIVKHGFDEMGGQLGGRMDKIETRMGKMEGAIHGLQEGQERIEMRLCNVAYRFELLELESRVKILESKMGIRSKE